MGQLWGESDSDDESLWQTISRSNVAKKHPLQTPSVKEPGAMKHILSSWLGCHSYTLFCFVEDKVSCSPD